MTTHITINVRDAFEEAKHPRASNGQFGAGTTVTKKSSPGFGLESHDVHHEGRHLGTVTQVESYKRKASGKASSALGTHKTWMTMSTDPKHRTERDLRTKADAVESLKRAHGIHTA